METVKKPWYKTGWGVILTILFFPILGTYLIWAKSGWKTWVKIISTLGIISIVVASNSQENEPTSTAATKTSTSSKKDYKYEILDLEGDIYKNVLVILVDDKISTEDLKETLKLAAKENIKDKFLNSLGGYQFWIFESWEIKKKAKPKKSIGRYTTRLRQNRSKTIGLTSDVSLTLKTKTPIDCQPIINDLIDSPDVLMYDPSGDDTDSRWYRLELDSNDAVLNNADRVYLNEISFNMPNYINRDL